MKLFLPLFITENGAEYFQITLRYMLLVGTIPLNESARLFQWLVFIFFSPCIRRKCVPLPKEEWSLRTARYYFEQVQTVQKT